MILIKLSKDTLNNLIWQLLYLEMKWNGEHTNSVWLVHEALSTYECRMLSTCQYPTIKTNI